MRRFDGPDHEAKSKRFDGIEPNFGQLKYNLKTSFEVYMQVKRKNRQKIAIFRKFNVKSTRFSA